jgi:hypothetical protein
MGAGTVAQYFEVAQPSVATIVVGDGKVRYFMGRRISPA